MERNRNKIIGSLIGGAIGDALGYPIEFKRGIKEREYTKYLNDKGIISDDTQMSLFTANGLLWRETRGAMRGIAPLPVDAIYFAYLDWLETQNSDHKNMSKVSWIKEIPELNANRAPGNTCLSALMSGKKGSIEQPINNSKGCGGVMRVAPIGLYIADSQNAGKFGAEASAITHGHPLGIIPSYFLSTMIYFIVNENLNVMDSLNKTYNQFKEKYNIFDKQEVKYFIELINKAIKLSKSNISDIDAINELGEGWVAEETFAIALYSCLKYENSFENAIICSINHDGDSDSTGAVTGNIMGALLGLEAIPNYYIDNLELKDIIMEIGNDLSSDIPVGEYNDNNDEYWLSKYSKCSRNLELKKDDGEIIMNNDNLIEKIVKYIKNMLDGDSDSIRNIYEKVCDNKENAIDLFKLQEEVEKRCEEEGIICDYSKWDNAIVGLPYDLEFIKKTTKKEIVNNMEEFKINNNITFDDEETKAEYQKYLDEVNEYNNKIANGEKPEKDLSAITEEFKEKFVLKSSAEKSDMKTTYDFDDLINKIDSKLNISSDNKSIDEQIKEIDERISNLEKQEDTVELVPESLKDFISFDNDGYAFANQKLPIELEIEYDNFIKNYYNSDNNKVVNNIVNKIINLPYDVETTIAQLIEYKPEEAFVSPLTQGIISNAVQKKCESNGIKLIENRDEFGGLAYNYKFKKIN